MDDAKQNCPEDSFVFGKVQLGQSTYSISTVIQLQNKSSGRYMLTKARKFGEI